MHKLTHQSPASGKRASHDEGTETADWGGSGKDFINSSLKEGLSEAILFTKVKSPLSIAILLTSIILSYLIISQSLNLQKLKYDSVELNHIKYGIFSTREWKKRLAPIISQEVSNFDLTYRNKKDLKQMIESQLNALIDKVNEKVREKNKKTLKGKLKQSLINAFVDVDDIKEGIPDYADTIIAQITKPQTEKKIKNLLKEKVDLYFQKTFQEQENNRQKEILKNLQTKNLEVARVQLQNSIELKEEVIYSETWILIFLVGVMFALVGFNSGRLLKWQYYCLLAGLFILLLTGVTTPMIDMEAKITEMSFVLMDHNVSFINQVLYFQSKSVLDVFWLMITHSKLEMKIVGILVVSFSIFFPLIKLAASYIYYFNFRGKKRNKWVQFFVLKSGKWSMTDVLVVAIFMAYVGFNGVIASQIGKLNALSEEMDFMTTNGTSLQPGFYLFFAYVVLGLFFAGLLKRSENNSETISEVSSGV